jgi:CHAD domain-containing protein
MGLETSHTSDLAASFEALSLESGRDPSKLSIELDEDASAYEALQTILGALLVVIRTNEAGTLADLDSEYLHDFRVSVRRTRAVLSELGDVFSEELSAHLKTEFRWLGSVTGATRDLDVLLLKLEDYAGLLGKSLRKGVADLEDSIRARRAIERGQMVALLQSDRYGALIEGCESALRSPDHVGKAAARSVRSVACERIAQRAKRVFKRAARIGPDCPARRVHDLRLECKKLRYLLEVFHSLCEPGPFAHVVKALKRIQTGLGDFNDYHVHADWLREIEGEQASGGLVNGTALPASTPLIPCLEKAAEKARKVTAERLTRFLTTENRRRFEQVIVKDAPDA